MTAPALGARLPELRTEVPGPASRAMAERLRRVESRNITYMDDGWPVFWSDARGANVVDADGNVFVDLTSAFGVGLLGHRSDPLERALADQQGRVTAALESFAENTMRFGTYGRGIWDYQIDAQARCVSQNGSGVSSAIRRKASGPDHPARWSRNASSSSPTRSTRDR